MSTRVATSLDWSNPNLFEMVDSASEWLPAPSRNLPGVLHAWCADARVLLLGVGMSSGDLCVRKAPSYTCLYRWVCWPCHTWVLWISPLRQSPCRWPLLGCGREQCSCNFICVVHTLHAVFLPSWANEETVSHPVYAWNIGNTTDLTGPRETAISWAAI